MLNAARAAGFSKYRLMYSPICWKELLNLKLMQIECMCITLMELSKHLRKNHNKDEEKLKVADMFNLSAKRETITTVTFCCQRCWLLCTSYSEYRTARSRVDLQRGAPTGLFLSPNQRAIM
jgi:hypothetical protein